ncbi:MAG: DMT family transporter [Opitutaceae bacterium]|jgi:drug/metabolite transporter (DMT)-like permease|nr:DMT family transporter [Opitutaceae bacterium]
MVRSLLLLLLGIIACSTAAVMIKASTTHPAVLAAVRLILAAGLLTPLLLRELRIHSDRLPAAWLRRTTLPSLALAAHFITWAYGARMTLTAQASLIVNLAPIAIPFFLHWLMRERITTREVVGTLLALAGVFVLSARDALAGGGDWAGNAMCFGSMLLFAWYLALGRKNRDVPSLWIYVVPIYWQSAVFCGVAALALDADFVVTSPREWGLLIGLAFVPTIIGHSLLNRSMRALRGQLVSVANLGQFIFAGLMAWMLFGEFPSPVFYAAASLVIAGVALVVLAPRPKGNATAP